MRIILMLSCMGLVFTPGMIGACDYVNAYVAITGGVSTGTYITIGQEQTDNPKACTLETLNDVYRFATSATCASTGFDLGGQQVWGDNLSGTYQVTTGTDQDARCIVLCACTP